MKHSDTCCIAYVTTPTKAVAATLGRLIVEKKLAACANVHGPIASTYRWKDKVEEAEEYVLLLKTTGAHYDELQTLVVEHHPYDNPCVVRLDIADGSPDYLNWIAESVL